MNLLELVFLNDELKPTFNNDRGSSFIDVTFVIRVLVANANWMVREDVSLSDHNLISHHDQYIEAYKAKRKQQKRMYSRSCLLA